MLDKSLVDLISEVSPSLQLPHDNSGSRLFKMMSFVSFIFCLRSCLCALLSTSSLDVADATNSWLINIEVYRSIALFTIYSRLCIENKLKFVSIDDVDSFRLARPHIDE